MQIKQLNVAGGDKLNLTNNGELDILFVGAGNAFAEKHFQNNFIIVKGDTHLAVDMGETWKTALRQTAGLGMGDIKNLFITHLHPDHANGAATWMMFNRYMVQGKNLFPRIGTVDAGKLMSDEKVKLIATEEFQRLVWDYCFRGGLEHNEEGKNTFARMNLVDYAYIVRPEWMAQKPREINQVQFGDINLQIFRTIHVPDSALTFDTSFVSYGIYLPDDKVLISCDTKFDPAMFEAFPDTQHIFQDVQFFHGGGVHASLQDLKTLDPELKAKMSLMHYDDTYASQNIDGFHGYAKEGAVYKF